MLDLTQEYHEIELLSHPAGAKRLLRREQTSATIVIPCYNEEKRLDAEQFLEFLKENPGLKFLFVNDGSKDKTIEVLRSMERKNPRQVNVLDLVANGGKAEAVRQGMIKAAKRGYRYVGYWDADLATPLYAIQDFLRVADRFAHLEIVYGTRVPMLGHKIYRKFTRRLVSLACSTLARFAIGIPVSDTQCGAKLFHNTDELQRALSSKFTAGWLFDVELFARLACLTENFETKIYEYPLMEWNEIPGSKIDMKAIIRSGLVMLKLIGDVRIWGLKNVTA